ncbi:unnamed protein product [Clonostachys rhizophaga]|uniref:SMP-30/Gluconolactonase/LRE-like region domain-containing protein n=1 Tax=Clonostachys rhizophaga TaxID=160324 RepID=A0A9N9VD72_9HYPO|nr:unnamed protein product [Clonostachys rhizophaga]
MLSYLLFMLILMRAELAQTEESITEIFNFNDATTFVENLHVLPSGKILLSTMDAPFSGNLLILDPNEKIPSFKSLVPLPGSNGLTGIAHLGGNVYAVTGGAHMPFMFENGTMAVYIVKVDAEKETGVLLDTIPVPDTQMLNGMDSIPANPTIVLSVDSIQGRMFRINTSTKEVDVAFTSDALRPSGNGIPLGANGLKIRGSHLYFTNSATGVFARIPIDSLGNNIGSIEEIASLDNVSMAGNLYDDFDIDCKGNAYLSVHGSSVNRVTRNGVQTTLAGGFNGTLVKDPTSVSLARDGKSVYVGTGGNGSGGQVLRITL